MKLAFYFSEKSKSAVLLETISDSEAKNFANIPDTLLVFEQDIKREITYYEQKIAEAPGPELEREYRDRLFTLNSDYSAFTFQLEQSFPDYFNLKYNVKTVSVEDLKNQMDSETGILNYFIAEKSERLFIFLISKNKFRVYNEPLEVDFDRYLTAFRNTIQYRAQNGYFRISNELYRQLFPFRIPKNLKHLVIIPDGRLGTIPFEALTGGKYKKYEPDYASLPYLINQLSVSYDYSSTLFHQKNINSGDSKNDSRGILLCAPVEFQGEQTQTERIGLADLPATESEVIKIDQLFQENGLNANVYLHDEAREEVIKSPEIENYKFLHFATHGIVNEESPQLSQIFLAPDSGEGEDGSLYSGEIYNLNIQADLVTLSACQTGLGKIAKGEGIIGLSRALTYAGANNLIVSLWSVSDESTSDLMVNFYQKLLTDPEVKSYSQAIRLAKLNLIINTDYPLPYYRAPFVLIGF